MKALKKILPGSHCTRIYGGTMEELNSDGSKKGTGTWTMNGSTFTTTHKYLFRAVLDINNCLKIIDVCTRIINISILPLAVRYRVMSIHTFGDCTGLVAVLFLQSQKQIS